MKGVLKRIGLYLGVAVLAFIATVILCAAFLFFYRDGNIFGFKYISSKQIIYAYADDFGEVDIIEIKGNDFPINIYTNSSIDVVAGVMRNRVYGYTRTSYAEASFKVSYNSATKTATFDVVEPSGWLAKNGSSIEIALPEEYVDNVPQIIVSSDKGNINIGKKSEELSIYNLEVKSNKGDVSVSYTQLSGDISFEIGSGEALINNSVKGAGAVNCYISVNSGAIGFNNVNDSGENVLEVNNFNIVKNKVGEIYVKKANRLLTDGTIDGGGKVVCVNAEYIDFGSKDTDLEIHSITGTDNSRIKITGRGEIVVNESSCMLDIRGYNGSVTLGNISNKVVIETNKGDITMNDASYLVDATSQSGDIKIKFAELAGDYNSSLESRSVLITSVDGNVVVDGLQKGTVNIKGKGRASLSYNKVIGASTINGGAGNVDILVPAAPINSGDEYAVSLIIAKGLNVNIYVGVVQYIGVTDEIKNFADIYNGTTSSTDNIIDVQSGNGKISVKSPN